MTARTWHKGPPPHVGWWNAGTSMDHQVWRWWNGSAWSMPVHERAFAEIAQLFADDPWPDHLQESIKWTDYWPENARVPRVDPRHTTISTEPPKMLDFWRQKHDAEVQDSQRARIEFKALELVKFAADLGFNVTIERRVEPTNPRSDTITVNVWPKRGAA